MKCDSTQDGYTSLPLLLAVAVHKLLVTMYILVSIPYLPGVLSITQTEHSTYITIPILLKKDDCT